MMGPRESESLYVESRSNGGASLKKSPIALATYSTEPMAAFSGRNALSTRSAWKGETLSPQPSGNGSACGASALLNASHAPRLPTMLSFRPARDGTPVSIWSSAFHDLSSSQSAAGLAGAPSGSGDCGFRKKAHSCGVNALRCRSIEAAIMKAKRPLCFSKRPRHIMTNIVFVMASIKKGRRDARSSAFSTARTVFVSTSLKYCNEYWYIGSTVVNSATTK
mmetsp:Transcript_2383/g.7989  ORF Transcript_2383/g.7989 Transcript_2383/m.7989 type:complete len:221 (-) Transcript_2383:367-1029(-)